MAAGGRRSFKLITPVGVFCFANARSSRTSALSQGSPDRCLYFGFAFLGPFFPMGESGRFQAACGMTFLLLSEQSLRSGKVSFLCPSRNKRHASSPSRGWSLDCYGAASHDWAARLRARNFPN
jgi:hypothetical protein